MNDVKVNVYSMLPNYCVPDVYGLSQDFGRDNSDVLESRTVETVLDLHNIIMDYVAKFNAAFPNYDKYVECDVEDEDEDEDDMIEKYPDFELWQSCMYPCRPESCIFELKDLEDNVLTYKLILKEFEC